ncbi:hypothetical protein ANO11243_053040 [Dothideomycetidae sp. 11243]|nr:hypothetical protein ANO11243_053040 [fungal sp. No.11243]
MFLCMLDSPFSCSKAYVKFEAGFFEERPEALILASPAVFVIAPVRGEVSPWPLPATLFPGSYFEAEYQRSDWSRPSVNAGQRSCCPRSPRQSNGGITLLALGHVSRLDEQEFIATHLKTPQRTGANTLTIAVPCCSGTLGLMLATSSDVGDGRPPSALGAGTSRQSPTPPRQTHSHVGPPIKFADRIPRYCATCSVLPNHLFRNACSRRRVLMGFGPTMDLIRRRVRQRRASEGEREGFVTARTLHVTDRQSRFE